ncbi:hypothetical protein FSP39_003750 [Pinctada imbricata]|uniref:Palmitoyltransferase n=1 Tax=Pinctada imbricata TaxID=66713 RepID=A0AA89BJX6_PINIB|nr:hypothetical protein FSP39_003750 [Pinctada imbricata]
MPFREILLWENLLLVTMGLLLINNVMRLRDSPGVVHRPQKQHYYPDSRMIDGQSGGETERDFPKSIEEMTAPTLPASDVTWIDSRPITDGKLSTWCSHCSVKKPPRSGHCRLCNQCVRIRDHHSIWLDTCIGVENHSAYFMVLLQTIFCGYYGSQLSMTTICTPEIYFDWFLVPNDCRFLYIDFRTAISFVTVCYMLVVTTLVVIATIWQLIFISQNVTQQEFSTAKRKGWVNQKIFVENNVHDQGIIMNLMEFFIVGRKSENTGKIQV